MPTHIFMLLIRILITTMFMMTIDAYNPMPSPKICSLSLGTVSAMHKVFNLVKDQKLIDNH